jgi:hypothetical protein
MINQDKGPFGGVVPVLGALLLGFVLGARIKIANEGAKIFIVPIGGDLVINRPPAPAPQTAPPSEADPAAEDVAEGVEDDAD